jgi:stress-induced morphogen
MKTSFYYLLYSVILTISFWGCSSKSEKIENKELIGKSIIQNSKQVNNLIKDSIIAYETFILNGNAILIDYEQQTSIIKQSLTNSQQSIKDKCEKQIEMIEFKNKHLKVLVNQHKFYTKSNWELFKISFNNEIIELNKLIIELDANTKLANLKSN